MENFIIHGQSLSTVITHRTRAEEHFKVIRQKDTRLLIVAATAVFYCYNEATRAYYKCC